MSEAHIKKIVIKGFKSYSLNSSELSDHEAFSPGLNVVVGRNGTGKSNLFNALLFVISDQYTNLSKDQRQMLLHEGPGDQVLSAFVEIVFDNTGRRFSIDKDEVTIRRAIGLKKDEFFLNKKHTTKQEIVNLLESAGLSRSNPYYIVQQGKIYELAIMTDEARLALLKEVAGTRVYDERRRESLKMLGEAENKKQQVEEMLQSLEDRLEELEEERTELQEFQALDRTRRSIQYAIYEHDRERASAKIADIEQERAELMEIDEEEAPEEASDELREALRLIKNLETEVSQKETEGEQLRAEESDLLARTKQAELHREECFSKLGTDQQAEAERAKELKTVKAAIKKAETKLQKLEPTLEKAVDQEHQLMSELHTQELRLAELYSREGRAAQFRTKKERDVWLTSEIDRIKNGPEATQIENITSLEEHIAATTKKSKVIAQSLKKQRSAYATAESSLRKTGEHINKLRQRRDETAVERKELWRREEELRVEQTRCETEVKRSLRALHSTTSREVAQGLDSMRRVVEDKNIEGVFGPLIELFTLVSDDYTTAVEITGGGSLFHVVVESDEVASNILQAMNQAKLPGRVTFMPLNRLRQRDPVEFPDSSQALSMINDCISFDGLYRPAMELCFGRTIVCPDLQSAATFAASHNLDGITLDGDKVDRKGAMTGGYHDRRTSRLIAARTLAQWHGKQLRVMEESINIKSQFRGVDKKVNDFVSQMQRKEQDQREAKRDLENATREIRSLTVDEQRVLSDISSLQSRLAQYEHVLVGLVEQRESLEAELAAAFSKSLSDDERAEMTSLSTSVEQLKSQGAEKATSRESLSQEKAALQELLASNLKRRLVELQTDNVTVTVSTLSTEVAAIDAELENMNDALDQLSGRIEQANSEATAKSEQIAALTDQVEQMRKTQNSVVSSAAARRKKMDTLLNNRALFLREMDQATRKIREVGTISAQEFEEYKEMTAKKLYAMLSETQQQLQEGYSHVNKKAGEQFISFLDQRDVLRSRKQILDEGLGSIRELLAVLDERKNEAILRTFKGVAKHFGDVFSEVVPDGAANLTMVKSSKVAGGKRKKPGEEAEGVESFVGVRINVSFGGTMGAPRDTSQLSGGQMSVVALCLIFAVQRTDPAPFYLFDEIDKAMDPAYRASIAKVIEAASQDAQYVIISHRPELVTPADNIYRTTFRNKCSALTSVGVDEALAVINAEAAAQQNH